MATVRPYPSDVNDDQWSFTAPYLCLISEEAAQRVYPLRDIFNALRYLAHTGCPWRYLPHDLPPWQAVYQQWTRWRDARVFETMVHERNEGQRGLLGREATPSAVILDGRVLPSPREWAPGGRGRAQTAQRQQGPPRRRYAGPLAERGYHAGQ